jgi:hypothetical protein
LHPLSHWRKKSESDPVVRGTDLQQNVTDPQHWWTWNFFLLRRGGGAGGVLAAPAGRVTTIPVPPAFLVAPAAPVGAGPRTATVIPGSRIRWIRRSCFTCARSLKNTNKKNKYYKYYKAVLGIRIRIRNRIRRAHMFLGFSDPHPDPLATSTDPASGSRFFHHQVKIVRKTLISTVFNFFMTLKNDVNVPEFRIRMLLGLPNPLVRGTFPRMGRDLNSSVMFS